MRSGRTSTATRRSAAITRSYSSQSSCVPPAAVNTSRSSRGTPSASNPTSASSGPASWTGPSTATHSHPARNTTVARGRARRLACLRVPPRATRPTTGSPSTGWSRTPAFATDAGGELYLLSGGGDRSDWVRNLRTDSAVTVRVRNTAYEATARVVDEGEESERGRRLVFEKYQPRYAGSLESWRRESLLVALDVQRAD